MYRGDAYRLMGLISLSCNFYYMCKIRAFDKQGKGKGGDNSNMEVSLFLYLLCFSLYLLIEPWWKAPGGERLGIR